MSKFTQGTWEVSEDFGGQVLIKNSKGKLIGEISDCLQFYDDKEEVMGNIRLIASASDMYRLIASFAALPDEQCMISPLIHEARKLIARIDGEEAES